MYTNLLFYIHNLFKKSIRKVVSLMAQYTNNLKKKLCIMICENNASTIKTAESYGIPLKTLEKWITAYNKNNHIFDEEIIYDDFHIISDTSTNTNNPINYDDLSETELRDLLMKRDIEIARLKKNYQVIENGMEKKVFVTFSKKNTK